ncbi:LysR family transcriptional regulator [uncultured Cohaesibacter sp.]|uniref:LysR family transcriptional regulator n=1 Tax=uncultured Cohaesibacter sp. TaxID=1002546 RepID=UPI0029C93A40|nr:LysR family transcriptional regulator [uncultured Cohaesibacter sp.]
MDRIQQMQVFIQIVESGNFTRAAEVLGLPRSTISTTVQTLEDRIGTRLFQRTTRQVKPTQDGLRFLETARELVETMERAENLFRQEPEDIRGPLRIDLPIRLARLNVIPSLPDFFRRYPNITLDLSATDRLIDLMAEGVDGVVRLAELENSDLICRRLGDMATITVASTGYVAEHGMPQTPDDLTEHWLVNYAQHMPAPVAEWDYMDGDRAASISMNSRICVDNSEAYFAAALSGLGLIQVPEHSVQRDIAEGRLVEVLPGYRAAPVQLSFIYHSRRNQSLRLRVFIDWLQELLKKQNLLLN